MGRAKEAGTEIRAAMRHVTAAAALLRTASKRAPEEYYESNRAWHALHALATKLESGVLSPPAPMALSAPRRPKERTE